MSHHSSVYKFTLSGGNLICSCCLSPFEQQHCDILAAVSHAYEWLCDSGTTINQPECVRCRHPLISDIEFDKLTGVREYRYHECSEFKAKYGNLVVWSDRRANGYCSLCVSPNIDYVEGNSYTGHSSIYDPMTSKYSADSTCTACGEPLYDQDDLMDQ